MGYRPGLNQRLRPLIALLVLFALLGIWRGWGLWDRGLLEHDEGHNLLAARTYSEAIGWALSGAWRDGGAGAGLAQMRDVLHRQGGTLYDSGKPGYIGLLSIWTLLVGLGQWEGLLLGWLGGMAVVVLSAVLAQQWFGQSGDRRRWAMIVAVAVALSPLLGGLGREVGGTVWALAFGLGGIAMLRTDTAFEHKIDKSNRKTGRQSIGLAVAGVLLAVGFTCHYNLLPLIVSALLADAAVAWRTDLKSSQQALWLRYLSRLGWVVAGMLMVIGTLQIVTWLIDRRLAVIYPEYEDYLSQLIKIITTYQVPALMGAAVTEGARGWGVDAFKYTFQTFAQENPLFLPAFALSLAGGVVMLVRRGEQVFQATPRQQDGLLRSGILLAGIVFFWAIHPWKVERSWGMVIVAAWLWIAGIFSLVSGQWSSGFIRHKKPGVKLAMLAVVLAGLFLWGAVAPWKSLWSRKSPIPDVARQALRYVISHGGVIAADSAARSFAPVWKWTIIEEGRRPELRQGLTYVDFSRFEAATIIFHDPNSADDSEFLSRYWNGTDKTLIGSKTSQSPPWQVAAYAVSPR